MSNLKESQLEHILHLFVKRIGLKVSNNSIDSCLQKSPEYPSLLSVSECLDTWKAPNNVYLADTENIDFDDFSFPIILRLKKSGEFVFIESAQGDIARYNDGERKHIKIEKAALLDNWDGMFLHVEKNEDSGEPDYKQKEYQRLISLFRQPILIAIMLLYLVTLFNFETLTNEILIAFFINFIATILCGILVGYSINKNNSHLTDRICSLVSNMGCERILDAQASKITSWLNWSEVGFYYFFGSSIFLLAVDEAIQVLPWLIIIALPYAVWSISYQFRHKSWCVFCCAVMALILIENAFFILPGLPDPSVSWKVFSSKLIGFLLSFLAPITAWSFFKPYYQKSTENKLLHKQLAFFKNNRDLFLTMLEKGELQTIEDHLTPINLGNPLAKNVITIVSNPFCRPCAEAHALLDEWLSSRNDLAVKIIFIIKGDNTVEKTLISKHLISLALKRDQLILKNALHDWFLQKEINYSSWKSDYPIEISDESNEIIYNQQNWCRITDVVSTPSIFVNGYMLPKAYHLKDLENLLKY